MKRLQVLGQAGAVCAELVGHERLGVAAAGLPVTVYGVATALERNPTAVAAMQQAGWEIASHGLKWIEYKDFTKEEERAHLEEAIRIHERVTGERPLGWYTGRNSVHTLDLVMDRVANRTGLNALRAMLRDTAG